MRLDDDYDPNNIFAKILRDEIPSVRIWQDDRAVALMDAFPMAKGHSLVLPRTPVRNLLDTPPDMLAHLMAVTQRVARASVMALNADGVRVMQFSGSASGQTIPHLHFHIVPMTHGQAMEKHGGGQAGMDELRELAGRIAAEMG